MRTLSGTLQAAQQGMLFSPYVRVQRRRMSALEDRFTPILGPAGPGSNPAVCAGNGKLSTYILSGGLKQTQYTGTPPAAGGATTVHADASNLVACSQVGTSIAVVTAIQNDAGELVNVYISTDGGSTWPTVESFSLSGLAGDRIWALSCAWNADASQLCIVTEGAARASATRRTGVNTYAATVYTVDTFTYGTGVGATVAPGIACVYSKSVGTGDWIVCASFFITTSSLYCVALYLFGGGDQQGLGTWSARQTVLSVLPYQTLVPQLPGSTLAVAGACLTADSVRVTMLENTRNPVMGLNTSRNYQFTCQSAALAKLGAIRESQALLVDSTTPLRPAYDPSTARLFYVNGTSVYYADRPATVDYTSRLLHAVKVETEAGTHATLVLDNADGSLTALAQSQDLPGDQLSLDFGYTTSAGNEVTSSAPLWVEQASAILSQGERTLELQARDAWAILAAFRPRRLYVWLTGQSTISQIIQWILARAGLPYVAPGSPSALLGTSPAFSIKPGENGAIALHNLLDMVPEVLVFTSAGGTLRNPQVADAAVYSYTDSVHPVQAARLSVYARSFNHVLVYGKNTSTATAPSLLAEAFDTADPLRIHDEPHLVRDMQLATGNAATRAQVPLRKSQLLQDAGEIATAPNVGLELFDPIAVTYAGLALSAAAYRVRELHTTYDPQREGGVYAQSVGLMAQ